MKFAVKSFFFVMCFSSMALYGAASDYEDAAAEGDSKAQYNLGLCYLNGDGIIQNDKNAFEWFKKAADHGYPHAECMVGLCYAFGKGVNQNDKKALEYFKKAANKDIAEAYYNLGWFNENGKGGLPADVEEAKKWYQKAADKEHGLAKEALNRLNKPKEQQNENLY